MKCGRQTIRGPFRGNSLYNALLGLNQASGLAGGFDYLEAILVLDLRYSPGVRPVLDLKTLAK